MKSQEPLPFESLSKLSKPLFLWAESQQGKLQLQKNLSEKDIKSWKKARGGQKAAKQPAHAAATPAQGLLLSRDETFPSSSVQQQSCCPNFPQDQMLDFSPVSV